MLKLFAVLLIMNFLHNYFDGPTKLFLDLNLAKFSDILTKSVFPCTKLWIIPYPLSFKYQI